MLFIDKSPCQRARVLDSQDCPPSGIEHTVNDYPLYYDPLYHPSDHPTLFQTSATVCAWLTSALRAHPAQCHICSMSVFHGHVSFLDDVFEVHINSFRSVFLKKPDLEKASYHHCQVFSMMDKVVSASDSSTVSECFRRVVEDDPPWLFYSNEHHEFMLSTLTVPVLREASLGIVSVPRHQRNKASFIASILHHFAQHRATIIALSFPDLVVHLHSLVERLPPDISNQRLPLITAYIVSLYGDTVATALRHPPHHPGLGPSSAILSDVHWISPLSTYVNHRLQKIPYQIILDSLKLIPPSANRVPSNSRGHGHRISALVAHIRHFTTQLLSMSDYNFFCILLSTNPFHKDYSLPRYELTLLVLWKLYASTIIQCFTDPYLSPADKSKQVRQDVRIERAMTARRFESDKQGSWPSKVSQEIVFECLREYVTGTEWKPMPVCAVCSRSKHDVQVVTVDANGMSPLELEVLLITDPFIIQKCIVQGLSSQFTFGHPSIDGFMLDKDGVSVSNENAAINVCSQCYLSLAKQTVPRFALKNNLYRGQLPQCFHDLTWVEEMACAIYRNMAHITRLYQSSDLSQPKVLHGNTCAHEANIVSTASVLPLTPADINGILSIIFIGPGKLDLSKLGTVFRVRKQKIWSFLLWLKNNNQLYLELPFDKSIVDLYPKDGILPGLDEWVTEDHETDVHLTFSEETAGFAEHPADMLHESDTGESDVVLLEKMGVSDPECDRIKGRAFMASALRNLLPSSALPDLVLHRGSVPIPEYHNPDLMPGMFPSLFPFGIGGFEDTQRPSRLSFQQQAEYFLDISDRVFRYHYSYIFVVLNMIQWRAAHLHMHFTVRRSQFHTVAEKLTSVSAETLRRLADHLEHEHNLSDLRPEEKDALDLLSKVNTIAARIPGSQASKLWVRNEIRSFFGFFMLPHIYFTYNPSATHSPLFLVMFGDSSVDLMDRFPKIPSGRERALRLAQDPVAAADFFEFASKALFKYLLGWDYETRSSTEKGGILGHLKAFYGTSEFTERGQLHGHFLIWLVGGMNPSELHAKLRDNTQYQQQFFDYFEDIIHHDLPNIDVVVDPAYEPRIECPFAPPVMNEDTPKHVIDEWKSEFWTDVKKCGEKLQRHQCRAVCHKYGNTDRCRFQFPHEVVETSHFDQETNAIVLKCLDGTVNYYNPYILTFCRHNHDIKCILSGRSAKAAMFYITDYITKMDLKTYEVLSLLSRAVAKIPMVEGKSSVESAKTLLHKCLSQFTRQQQIHAQQAIRYIRGFGDGISSHETTPMMSGMLLAFVRETYQDGQRNQVLDDPDDEETELTHLRVMTDRKGNLIKANQVHHYFYRGDSLTDMCFYEFCRCVRIEQMKHAKDRVGTYRRHLLKEGHPLSATHVLVEHTNEERGDIVQKLVPHVIGASIPCVASHRAWAVFTLAHFKPFGVSNSLLSGGDTFESVFENYQFTSRSLEIMRNWEAIFECEDARDADRLRKRVNAMAKSQTMTAAIRSAIDIDQDDDITTVDPTTKPPSKCDLQMHQYILRLQQSSWFESTPVLPPLEYRKDEKDIVIQHLPETTASRLKTWKRQTKEQEVSLAQAWRNALNPESQVYGMEIIKESETHSNIQYYSDHLVVDGHADILSKHDTGEMRSADEVIYSVGKEYGLNEKQWISFQIVAYHFIDKFAGGTKTDIPALRMLMTGPGGTGKTHVVRAVKKVMSYYGQEHKIRFLAPTGSAAALIDGMTVHKGLSIKIQSNTKTKKNQAAQHRTEDYTVLISVKNRVELRDEWKNVEILLINEVSLLSAQLLSEIDHALRYAKECPDDWFGNVSVIFAGDFCQYPPVGGTLLYTPISRYANQSNQEIQRRLGRLAWKNVDTVVTLTEQQQMRSDPAYGDAVSRLRVHKCTLEDVDMFNSRLMKSAVQADGVDMSKDENWKATVIVSTNSLREMVNIRKAESNAKRLMHNLVVCAALDQATELLSKENRQFLLNLNVANITAQGSLPGFLSLYVGMPVILHMRNISTDLAITNGSQGYVRKISTSTTVDGFTYSTCVIVEFPDSKIQLLDLPYGHFPITPISWQFTTILPAEDGKQQKVRITRHQLPIQPGFAVTGQSAQGKTLPQVIVNLHEGGFGAYVAASRARTREGICIIQHVMLDDLNKPVPYDLFQEVQRFDAIEHNTYVRYGILNANPLEVPNPESERSLSNRHKLSFQELPANNKRKLKTRDDSNIENDMTKARQTKKPRTAQTHTSQMPTPLNVQPSQPIVAGCSWDAHNWSCAYNSVFMLLFFIYKSWDTNIRTSWRSDINVPYRQRVSELLDFLVETPHASESTDSFNRCQESLRDYISTDLPITCPRYGQVGCAVTNILELFVPSNACRFLPSLICTNGCPQSSNSEIHFRPSSLPSVCS